MFILRWFRREFTRINSKFVYACISGDLRGAKTLLKQGADIHAEGDCALRWAANNGCLDVVKYLVEQGADIHARGDEALIWATHYEHLGVVNFLRETVGTGYKCHGCLIKSTCLKLCKDFRAGEK